MHEQKCIQCKKNAYSNRRNAQNVKEKIKLKEIKNLIEDGHVRIRHKIDMSSYNS